MIGYDVDYLWNAASVLRVSRANRLTGAKWIAEPEATLGGRVLIGTIGVEDEAKAELWREVAKPKRMVPMNRDPGHLVQVEVPPCDET